MGYFKSDNKFIYLDTQSAHFYIPKVYFTNGFSTDYGNKIHTFGVFNITINTGSKTENRVFNVPTWINLYSDNSSDGVVKINNEDVPCKILDYIKGSKITESYNIIDSSNSATFLDFILKGKIPNNIPYSEVIKLWDKNCQLNDVNLGVMPTVKEMVLSVAYRYKKDPNKKFAHVIGANPNISELDYVMYNIRQICQYSSTFAGLTFEDFDSMVTTSLNRTVNKVEEQKSPIEDLFKM